jgi:ABC-type multidrug transport system ATPase subunit
VLLLIASAGAGKTTLLTALAGRASYGILSGRVTINGRWAVPFINIPCLQQLVAIEPRLLCQSAR